MGESRSRFLATRVSPDHTTKMKFLFTTTLLAVALVHCACAASDVVCGQRKEPTTAQDVQEYWERKAAVKKIQDGLEYDEKADPLDKDEGAPLAVPTCTVTDGAKPEKGKAKNDEEVGGL